MSNGVDRSRDRRRRELTDSKKINCKYRLRIYLRDNFRFAEQQQTATFGLGYKLRSTRNTNDAVLNKDGANNKVNIKINVIEWHVPHYTPSPEEYTNLLNQITKRLPTELHYPERSLFMKEVNTQIF